MTENLTHSDYEQRLKEFKANGFKFAIVETGSGQQYIKIRGTRIYCERTDKYGELQPDPTAKELQLFKLVERDAKRAAGNFPPISKTDTVTALFNVPRETMEYEGVEIDITAAYPHAAYKLGIISKETLEKITAPDVSKTVRLQLIGSLASRQKITHYEGRKVVGDEYKEKPTRHLFFWIASEIGNVCKKILQEFPEAYFFWVDAIFCPPSIAEEIIKRFEYYGYTVKTKPLHRIQITKTPTGIGIEVHDQKGVRPFALPNHLQRQFFNEWAGRQAQALKKIGDTLEYYKDGDRSAYSTRDEIIETIGKAFGTTNIERLPFDRIMKIFEKKGIAPEFFFVIRERVEGELKILDANLDELKFFTVFVCAEKILHLLDFKKTEDRKQAYNPTTGELDSTERNFYIQ